MEIVNMNIFNIEMGWCTVSLE